MKKNVIVYGLIAGLIVSVLMILITINASHCTTGEDLFQSMLIGYAAMLVAFSLVFVGIRNYRDKYKGGIISFGKAFKTGILIVLIASTIYVIAWLITYFFFMPEFAEKFATLMVDKVKAKGGSLNEIAEETKKMANFVQNYNNPFFNAMMTYIEILPVGLIVTVISSLILKRKTIKK